MAARRAMGSERAKRLARLEVVRPTPDRGKGYVAVSGVPISDETGRFAGCRGSAPRPEVSPADVGVAEALGAKASNVTGG